MLTTGQVRNLVGHEHFQVWAAAYSPDGRLIATGCVDTTVRIWDAATGKELRTLTGHSDRIMALTFSPDSKRLVSGCWDGTAKVWDVDSGKEQHTLRGHIGVVYSIAFHPDGRYLATGSGYRSKGEVTVWDLRQDREALGLDSLEREAEGVSERRRTHSMGEYSFFSLYRNLAPSTEGAYLRSRRDS